MRVANPRVRVANPNLVRVRVANPNLVRVRVTLTLTNPHPNLVRVQVTLTLTLTPALPAARPPALEGAAGGDIQVTHPRSILEGASCRSCGCEGHHALGAEIRIPMTRVVRGYTVL